MDFAEEGWQIMVNARDEGDASDTRHRGSHAACISDGNQQRGNDAEPCDAQGGRAAANGLKYAVANVHGFGRQNHQQSHRGDNVHGRDQSCGAVDSAGQSFARLPHLFAHGAYQFQSGEGEGDIGPKIDGIQIPYRQR